MATSFLVTDPDQDRILEFLRTSGQQKSIIEIAEGTGQTKRGVLLALVGLVPGGHVKQSGNLFSSRLSRCYQCGAECPSSERLPHFQVKTGAKDSHYCGCRGWD